MDNLLEVFSRDRRFSQRHNFKTALRVRVWKSGLPEERAESVNLSQRGIFFASSLRIAEGEVVEIPLKMPEEITGQPATEWRCTGQAVRVELADSLKGKFGVGVQFYCYEASRFEQPNLPDVPKSLRDMPVHHFHNER